MKANIFLIVLLSWIFFGNKGYSLPVSTKFISDSLPNKFLIINSFDVRSIKARNNKRELLRELTDSLKSYLAKTIKKQTGAETVVIPGVVSKSNTGNFDSLVFVLMEQNKAGKAVVVVSNEVYFEETGVEETTDFDGKVKNIASWDLCAKNTYTLFDKNKILQQSIIDNCEFFTTRNQGGGRFVIAIGPNVVSRKKHTFGIVAKNAEKYVSQICPQLGGICW